MTVMLATFGALPGVQFMHVICHLEAQEVNNPSNGVRFGVEMKGLQPLEANHSKLKEEFYTAAKSPFCCEMISQPFCTVLWNSS